MKINAKYKAQKKKSDDQEQLPEPIKRKQTLSTERVIDLISEFIAWAFFIYLCLLLRIGTEIIGDLLYLLNVLVFWKG